MDSITIRCGAQVPPGSRSPGTVALAQDQSTATEIFKLDEPDNIWNFLQYVLGYSKVNGTVGTTNWTLNRSVPARHPWYRGLRATRILNIQGIGGPDPDNVVQPANGLNFGGWQQLWVTVQFEQPQFAMAPDSPNPEYLRWTTKVLKPSLETLARRGANWAFVNLPTGTGFTNANPLTYNNDVYLRQPKGILEIKWMDVPEEWTHLGGLIPKNILKAVGTVNSRAFPQTGFGIDQNKGSGPVQFPPGTLLFLEPDVTPRTRFEPNLFRTGTGLPPGELIFPRSNDWTFRWLYFDPDVDVAQGLLVAPLTDPLQSVLVRGHNLLPLPNPSPVASLNGAWYPAVNIAPYSPTAPAYSATTAYVVSNLVTNGGSEFLCIANTTGNAPPNVAFWLPISNRIASLTPGMTLDGPSGVGSPGGDLFLQYPYFDHELIFSWVRSGPNPGPNPPAGSWT